MVGVGEFERRPVQVAVESRRHEPGVH
jgi:hypothetical protein